MSSGLVLLEVDRIQGNPYQPRRSFDPEEIAGLRRSLERTGMLQPLLVRRKQGVFELVAGERRLRAARLAGWKQVPVLVKEVDESGMRLLALVENLQRRDLNPMEKARSFDELQKQAGWTQEELADRVGLRRSSVTNYLRLLELPPSVQQELRNGRLGMGHARTLLGAPAEAREALLARVLGEGLSVRTLETLVKEALVARDRNRGDREGPKAAARRKAAWALEMEENLRAALGCRARVQFRGGRGKITLEIGSREEFDRVYELLLNALPHEKEEELIRRKLS